MPRDSGPNLREVRLALVSASLEGGGAERQLAEMANYWAERNVRVTLITWSGPGLRDVYRVDPRVARVYLDTASTRRGLLARIAFNLRRILRLRAVLAKERPDAVLSFIAENNVLTILASIGLRVRIVVSERAHPAHDTTVPRVWAILRGRLYSRCDAVVAQTHETARWIEQAFRVRTHVIANALRELPVIEKSRESLIVGVGRLAHQKGFDLLMHAFARVADEFPQWNVAILGEGPQRDGLLRLRDELGLSGRVRLPGRICEIESWLSRAGIVAQPSRFEGFPNAVLEAMGMGAAVISADCPSGPADLIQDSVNGRLVPVDNVEALTETLRWLMARPEERARLGAEAVEVRDRFRQDRIMAQWEACLLPDQRIPTGRCAEVEGL